MKDLSDVPLDADDDGDVDLDDVELKLGIDPDWEPEWRIK